MKAAVSLPKHVIRYASLPTKQNEAWKYTNLKPFVEQLYKTVDIDHESLNAANQQGILIHNHDVQIEHIIPGVSIHHLSSVLGDPSHPCYEMAQKRYHENEDGFVALNTRYAQHGVIIHVKAHTKIRSPLHLSIVTDLVADQTCYTQNILLLEDGAELTLIEHMTSSADNRAVRHHVSRGMIGKNACLNHEFLQITDENTNHFYSGFMDVYEDATYQAIAAHLGGGVSRYAVESYLLGKNAKTSVQSLSWGKKNQHQDVYFPAYHHASHTKSEQHVKQLMDDGATGIYYGVAHIPQRMVGCEAHQHNKNILLSDKAEIFARPELHVDTDQVMCTHGATVGSLDDEALYYLQSRGIALSEARKLLIEAFLYEMVEGNAEIRRVVEEMLWQNS